MLVLAAFASLIVWTVWSISWPYEFITMKPGSWVVENPGKRVSRGGILLLHVDYCADFENPPLMASEIEQDSRVMLLKTIPFPAPTGCHSLKLPVSIPDVMALESTTAKGTGHAILRVHLMYRVNAVRDVTHVYVSDDFVIDP
jgi:hypothetical protein